MTIHHDWGWKNRADKSEWIPKMTLLHPWWRLSRGHWYFRHLLITLLVNELYPNPSKTWATYLRQNSFGLSNPIYHLCCLLVSPEFLPTSFIIPLDVMLPHQHGRDRLSHENKQTFLTFGKKQMLWTCFLAWLQITVSVNQAKNI